ncbi:uncharacterized protein LOC110229549 [Arabidopsis lyrata subsp. lyrata]|uniref:uncharacterized protein LOC110229549 n=1 Tax=Arabidopsis lyrata subsp. lyrata TaxID=81972 RepID=UPI000A29A5BC|nr:uncharacterized protein LOC110229549 [Arabidopsis lyrata subsp. lyrata]|eukprot:XP_020885720.1 uncharacterized protein LOC110229549 [Arabidopsis lyrata subsp. lyrata]
MTHTTHENGMRCTFHDLVRAIPLTDSFEAAWEKFPVKRFYMESYISKDRVQETFEKARRSIFQKRSDYMEEPPDEFQSKRVCLGTNNPSHYA